MGDIVRIEDREMIPADLVVLSTALPQGACYIETSNLDGETNLKLRNALETTHCVVKTEASLASLRGKIL